MMPDALANAVSYKDFCDKIAEAIMSGNMALAGINFDGVNINISPLASVAPSAVPMNTPAPAAPTISGPIYLTLDVGGERFKEVVIDIIHGYLEERY